MLSEKDTIFLYNVSIHFHNPLRNWSEFLLNSFPLPQMPILLLHIFLLVLIVTFNFFAHASKYCLLTWSSLRINLSSLSLHFYLSFNCNDCYFLYSSCIFRYCPTFSSLFFSTQSSTSITSQHFLFSQQTLPLFHFNQSLLHLWWIFSFICLLLFSFRKDSIFFVWIHWTWWHSPLWCPNVSSFR